MDTLLQRLKKRLELIVPLILFVIFLLLDGGNPHIRFRGRPGRGDQPGLLNSRNAELADIRRLYAKRAMATRLTTCHPFNCGLFTTSNLGVAGWKSRQLPDLIHIPAPRRRT
jgi:hypothetical protein